VASRERSSCRISLSHSPHATDGGKTYTFQVRLASAIRTVRSSSPRIFKRAIERLFVVPSDAGGASYYGGIVGADRCTTGKPCDLSRGITADRAAGTITFHLTEPDADFLAKLALPFAIAVPRATPARTRVTRPLPATGPYRIAAFQRSRRRFGSYATAPSASGPPTRSRTVIPIRSRSPGDSSPTRPRPYALRNAGRWMSRFGPDRRRRSRRSTRSPYARRASCA
jgi:hypothetical protein